MLQELLQLAEIRHVPALDFAIVADGLAVPTMRSIALTPAGSAGIFRLVVLCGKFLAIPFLNPCIRFRVRRFFDLELPLVDFLPTNSLSACSQSSRS